MTLDTAADAIARARGAAEPVDSAALAAIVTLEDGYRVQADVLRRLGGATAWKPVAVTAAQRASLGVDRPLAARIALRNMQPSPARFGVAGFLAPRLEAEFGFRLSRPLPPRAEPYSRAEIEEAIAAMHPTIEIVDARVAADAPMPHKLADSLGNGGLVVGDGVKAWRAIDFKTHAVVLKVKGAEVARGSGISVMDGDPVGTVALLANHQPPGSEGLAKGNIVTTGSCTGVTPIAAGDEAVADFGPLGQVRVAFF